jgi:hypothetical protein
MRKLFVAGCSISTRNICKTSYPEELSKLLNYELVNCAAGCGCNYRIWRMLTKHIMDGNLTSDDLVIIQYTSEIRREFWSRFGFEIAINTEEPYDDGKLIRFKPDSYLWQKEKEEIQFFKLYEENFINDKFSKEVFDTNNFNFQNMLKNYNIKVIFLKTDRMNMGDIFLLDEYKKMQFYDKSNTDWSNNQTETDDCHFSDKGHKLMAENLYKHIINLKLNEQ